MNLFADDAKLLRVIKTREDCLLLQEDLNTVYEWSRKWKLEFNGKKCHIMELGKIKRRPIWNYLMGEEQIMNTKEEKDLGVIIQENLSLYKHISKISGLSYKMLTNIRVAFHYMDKNI
ncbi:hypothetical protein E2C01_058631 [Portunus trituberculatus]|uniref:Reverse transcriptase domain-containing protein n=1 Tax=Portunus trituberculatus TaxID=210409 RepID=A0A5B7H6P2_PORTR|nr:hypothetical protein [Portunus trituberculatus]